MTALPSGLAGTSAPDPSRGAVASQPSELVLPWTPMGGQVLAQGAVIMRKAGVSLTWIYFIQSGADGPVKIGVARDPADRLRTLQQGNPVPLRLLGVYRGLALEERQLHAEFASARISGEWFEPTPEVLEMVRALGVSGGFA